MNTLTYAGTNLNTFGVWFDSSRKYKKPAKRYLGFDVPARNGTLYASENKFDNVVIEYRCYIKENFATNYNNLINFLNSFDTYQVLENSVDNTVYRLALFHEELSVDTGQFLKDGQFSLFFDCKPQAFLKTGDTELVIQSETSAKTGNPITIDDPYGVMTVTSVAADVGPTQDLHGYSKPWAGGAEKNKLPYPYSSGDGLSTNSIVFTANSDGSLSVTGTASANSDYYFVGAYGSYVDAHIPSGSYILSLGRSGGTQTTTTRIYFVPNGGSTQYATEASPLNITIDSSKTYRIFMRIMSGGVTNATYYPMIRPSTVSDSTWEPYENICPITGYTEVNVAITGGSTFTTQLGSTVYGGSLNMTTGALTVTHANIASYAGQTINEPWFSSLDGYLTGTTPTTGAQVVYPLTTPTTASLTPQQVTLIAGTNVITCNSGDMTITLAHPYELENPSYMESKPIFKLDNETSIILNGETVITYPSVLAVTDKTTTGQGYQIKASNNVFTISGNVPAGTYDFPCTLLPEGTYKFYRNIDGVNCTLIINNGTNRTVNTGETFTIADDDVSMSVRFAGNITGSKTFKPVVTLGAVYVDCELMDCYLEDGTNANPYVQLTDGFITLPRGVSFLGTDRTQYLVATVKPRWWRL